MNSWNEGYFTESTYTYGYYFETNPAYQNFCLLLRGIYPSMTDEDGTHCELGYGQGVSININAAATPGKYFGTDFNPTHASHANELLRASGASGNFFDDSFEEMLERKDLPKFDTISLHGIWSWISPENQKHIVEFARRFLKPSGILYNSYNCFPGWAPYAPMRELLYMHEKYAHQSANTYKRVEEAIKFTEDMLGANPLYLQHATSMKNRFEETRKMSHDYLAHEYFNENWICMYFSDVAEMFQQAKLDFACTAAMLDAANQFNLTKEAMEFLSKIENPIMREQARDYFVSRQFRGDIYVRGIRRMPEMERISRLLETRYVLLSAEEVSLTFNVPLGEVTLKEELYHPMLAYLSEDNYRPKNLLAFHQEHPEISIKDILEMLVVMVHRQLLFPCQKEENARAVKKQCDALNAHLCNRARHFEGISFLASPVTGSGFGVDRIDQMFLHFHRQKKRDADALAGIVWETLSSQKQKLVIEGKTLETEEENIKELKSRSQKFLDIKLPILKALQIV